MAEALAFLGFMFAVLILAAVLAILRVLRCSLSRPQKKAGGGGG